MKYVPGQPVWVFLMSLWRPGEVIRQIAPICPHSGAGAFYEVDVPSVPLKEGVGLASCPCFMRPRDEGDRMPTTWDRCAWRPRERADA